ncbi:iron-dicitrate transporter subunit FecD [Bacillus glycinifermentans]|uniref:Iron chelate uptake ABC transporter family permease subunit n=1 Tax=Bacillus glycinifermentans TaxID=1664069 RepID=A0A0J6F212_9BACI|nr:iron chelate uptake ABC transporter family permease subunit [Bacillus glycinifermentans]ATH94306.1 iron ABC transporter permease [Bacillus glycinifermentans]KMM63034.1 iron-dicitrate transporter subunit FecD [Bacillus glycinifermentans]KRT95728.1 iron-dicitrate transporter subunit FecD [Bacillus glycinifermentans]MEC0484377.1 iron chelate uptake ABC transporter family permease subunit [Bacillus glycinifermentans]MEC0496769.1 iron chelate uptake ABC transporter family permease subunit [Bacil
MKKSLHIKHPFMMIILLFLVMLVCVIISIGFGALYIAPGDVIKNLFGISSDYQFIIQKYRLARVILAVLAGAGLGVSGAILQGVIRNPLASPDVIGITKGASLAAMVVILLFPAAPLIVLPLSAFAGAGLVAVLLMVFVRKKNARPSTIALVGIALGAICHAGMQYMMVKFPGDVNAALIWVTGSLWGRSWDEIKLLAPWLALCLPILFLLAAKLDLMSLGDELVDGLGERSARLRFMLIFVAVGLAGSCVAVVGSIGFVGLIAPHIARRLVGTKSKYLLPASGLAGSIILLAADSLGRGLMPPVEIPAGILTAIIGAPYFLYLLKAESAKK